MTLWLDEQAELTLMRLRPRLEAALEGTHDRDLFLSRVSEHFTDAFAMFYQLYGEHYDFYYHLEQTILTVAQAFSDRSAELKTLDAQRLETPDWFQSQNMIGAVCYVDLFAGNLQGIRERLPYFQEMGLTYLHLMPFFRAPEAHSDGGYAVSSFREVNPALGTMQELAALANELREQGISLCLDFVFNHTSDEHEWAQRALAGDKSYQDYYFLFEDRTLPDRYEADLREILPEQAPGSFTFRPEINQWVWTTFYNYQWDLNYANPEVFSAMLGELLFLGNQGAEVLRLDAVPFIWKELGTNSENLPQVHAIIRGFNAFARMAAPALLFNSEAIVHPTDVRSYVDSHECQISYNPILMSSIWEALATRSTDFLRHTMNKQFSLPPGCVWLNYLRSHDDIGWGFADEDAVELGINSEDHRYFLNLFYLGRYPGSFAAGLPFNFNPRTQDMRISGTTASLAGLEKAEKLHDDAYRATAIKRIVMIHSLIMSVGGIPLIYLGDEIGTPNDYRYRTVPEKAADSRWVHRPHADPEKYARRHEPATVEGQIFGALLDLIEARKRMPVLADGETYFITTGNSHVLGFTRHNSMLVLANFAEFPQQVDLNMLQNSWHAVRETVDLITEQPLPANDAIHLDAYQFMWLVQPD
ncbi:MAG: amylosucrase [Chloroflexota bacterium]